MKRQQLNELLYEALETERGGVLVYETAVRCAVNTDLREEWQKYLGQTREHERILLETFERIGLDPVVETPGRQVVRHIGQSLVAAMEKALAAGNPEMAQVVAAECVVHAETKDHMNWELIGVACEAADDVVKEALKDAYDAVEDEEDEHLYHTMGWARELHVQALGLPAQLPPPEEEKDVKSAMAAAKTRMARKKALKKQI
jgi:hypothetical protein